MLQVARKTKMSLLDNLNEAEDPQPVRKKCIVARLLSAAQITPEESEKFEKLLWSGPLVDRVPTTHLARALRKSGIAVSDKSLERHRFYDCSCTR